MSLVLVVALVPTGTHDCPAAVSQSVGHVKKVFAGQYQSENKLTIDNSRIIMTSAIVPYVIKKSLPMIL